jgi:hypothetical protein
MTSPSTMTTSDLSATQPAFASSTTDDVERPPRRPALRSDLMHQPDNAAGQEIRPSVIWMEWSTDSQRS